MVVFMGQIFADVRKEGRRALLAFASSNKDRHYKEEQNAELNQEPDQDNDTGLHNTEIMSEATLVLLLHYCRKTILSKHWLNLL